MAVCVYKYFLRIVEDQQIKVILEEALSYAQQHVVKITQLLQEDRFQIPMGFTEEDVNLQAPRLFSDPFLLYYSYIMTIHGLTAYSLAVSCCEREDVQDYFMDCIATTKRLFQSITVLGQSQPKFSGIPRIPSPTGITFIQSTGILENLIGDKRPLNASEISSLIFNAKKTGFVRTLSLAFSQVAEHQEIREFMLKNVKLAGKDADSFDTILQEDDLAPPPRWDDEITDTKTSPFSDKLMMAHASLLVSTSLSYYGAALGSSLRTDLILNYRQVANHALQAGGLCYNIMVEHGWMEKQPECIDRRSLALQ